MKILILSLFLYFVCFKTIVEADDGNTKANSEQSESTRPKGDRSMSFASAMYYIHPETGEVIMDTPLEELYVHDSEEKLEDPYDPYAISEDMFMSGIPDKAEVYDYHHVYPEAYSYGSEIAETMFMLGDPEIEDMKVEFAFNDPIMQPYETHMSNYDTYMTMYDPYMQPYDSYMPSSHCDCPCMYDNHYDSWDYDDYDSWDYYNYDSWDYYDYDSWDYYGNSGESEMVSTVTYVGSFLPEISGHIAQFRTEVYDIKMMISQWDSLSALEELISSAEGISLADIFPRDTLYSIIGEEILKIMDKTQFERILDIAETFFRSDEIALLSFHLVTYEGTIPVVEYLIEGLQHTGIMRTFIEMFGEITWLRKATMIMKDMPWMNALIDGVGKILKIEDDLYDLGCMAIEIEKARFGGCDELAILRRCADETFTSIETMQAIIKAMDPYYYYIWNYDGDREFLDPMDCILTDKLCREYSVKDVAENIRPTFEHQLECYSNSKTKCNEAKYKSTTDYIDCYQRFCE